MVIGVLAKVQADCLGRPMRWLIINKERTCPAQGATTSSEMRSRISTNLQVDGAAGEVAFEAVDDEPRVAIDGFRADERPRKGELAGRGRQPVPNLVGAVELVAVIDHVRVACERGSATSVSCRSWASCYRPTTAGSTKS